MTCPRHVAVGEEPLLGSALGREYIAGLQGEGVGAVSQSCSSVLSQGSPRTLPRNLPAGAVPKHFVLNAQETGRGSMSAEAPERALFELYYPPFEAAVGAGAVAVMCAHNRVNGTHACGSPSVLQRDLKSRRHFLEHAS